MTNEIKKLKKKDLQKSLELIKSYDGFNLDVPDLAQLWVYFKRGISLGYFDNGNLVGLVISEITLNSQVYIWYLIVDPLYRGRGIGKKIIMYLEEKLKKKKMDKVFLNSSDESVEFYRKLNFISGGDVKEMIKFL